MSAPIGIGIIHLSSLIREGVKDQLNRSPGVQVLATFDSAREALDRPIQGDHILLYDVGTSHQDGPALMAELRQRLPRAKILVFGVADDDQAIIECVRAGASGCILQNASLDDLVQAIRSISQGTAPVSPRVVTTLFSYVARLQAGDDSPPAAPLTRREEEILQLIAEGLDNKEIAQRLYLQPQTVKNYVHQVLQKLNLRSRLEVIRSMRSPKR
ncbi:MAG TPA: response regulator transcription factor [bacterium]|nr:response regulator transcription factor [bacterium]